MLPLSTASLANSRQSMGSSLVALDLRRLCFFGFIDIRRRTNTLEEQGSGLVVIDQGLGIRVEIGQELFHPRGLGYGGIRTDYGQDGYTGIGRQLLKGIEDHRRHRQPAV